MSQVYVISENLAREQRRKFRTCFGEDPFDKYVPIHASQLVDALNSTKEDGPDRYFMLRDTALACGICRELNIEPPAPAIAICNENNRHVCEEHAYWCNQEGHGCRQIHGAAPVVVTKLPAKAPSGQ